MMTVVTPGGDGRAAVARTAQGQVVVHLDADHPGVADPEYRARRDAIAQLATDWNPDELPPVVDYTEAENRTWRTVCRHLRPLWDTKAATTFREAVEELDLPASHVPQLREVSDRLGPITAFRYLPVAGLAPLREFYSSFADGVFWSTQYLRHDSMPLYTPEPDLCHEVLGHANQLANRSFADLYRRVAAAAQRTETRPALAFLSKVFWFTVEFGVVWEHGDLRAYGAGLLSSYGEMQAFDRAQVLAIDWAAMGTQAYDITHYQPILFAAPSMAWLFEEFSRFLDAYDDDRFESVAKVDRSSLASRRRS
jgi:phenylalanine-4-hydroxylase